MKNFNDFEFNLLNEIKRNDTRHIAMVVYAKMKKYANANGTVTRSINDILILVNKSIKLARSNMFRILKKLRELGLLISDRKNYYLTSFLKNGTKSDTKSDTPEKAPQDIENTSIENDEEILKYKLKYNTINTIHITNPSELVAEEDKVKVFGKVLTKEELKTKAVGILKELGSKSKNVKEAVINKIENGTKSINSKGANSYLTALVLEKYSLQKEKNITNQYSHLSRKYNSITEERDKEIKEFGSTSRNNFFVNHCVSRDRNNSENGYLSHQAIEEGCSVNRSNSIVVKEDFSTKVFNGICIGGGLA